MTVCDSQMSRRASGSQDVIQSVPKKRRKQYECQHAQCEFTSSQRRDVNLHEEVVNHKKSNAPSDAWCVEKPTAEKPGGVVCGVERAGIQRVGHDEGSCMAAKLSCNWGTCNKSFM